MLCLVNSYYVILIPRCMKDVWRHTHYMLMLVASVIYICTHFPLHPCFCCFASFSISSQVQSRTTVLPRCALPCVTYMFGSSRLFPNPYGPQLMAASGLEPPHFTKPRCARFGAKYPSLLVLNPWTNPWFSRYLCSQLTLNVVAVNISTIHCGVSKPFLGVAEVGDKKSVSSFLSSQIKLADLGSCRGIYSRQPFTVPWRRFFDKGVDWVNHMATGWIVVSENDRNYHLEIAWNSYFSGYSMIYQWLTIKIGKMWRKAPAKKWWIATEPWLSSP